MSSTARFGWLMFVVSGVIFMVLGIRDREPLVVAGAAVWMIGCAAFLVDGRD